MTLSYDRALRGVPGWWRGVLAIVSMVVAFLLISTILGGVAVGIDLLLGSRTIEQLTSGQVVLTPALMLFNNLSLAAMIPVSMLLQWAFFGVRPRYLASVLGRFRWGWFGRFALLVVPIWLVYVGVSFVLDPIGPVELRPEVVAMVLVVLLTTPFQAAGEEYATRGLVQRAAGSWIAHPGSGFAVGALLQGVLFSIAHFAADPWLIAYYFSFAVAMGLLARWTGGLEAPVLVHVVNNVLLLVPVALAGETDEVFERGAGVGSAWMLLPMLLVLGVAVLGRWWARRSGVDVAAAPPPSVRRGTTPPSGPSREPESQIPRASAG